MIRRPRSTQSRGQDLFESRHFVAARHPVATRPRSMAATGVRHIRGAPAPPATARVTDPRRRGLPSASVAGARVLASPPARAHIPVNRRKDQPTSVTAAVAALVGIWQSPGVTFGTALATGSSAMIAEGIHSLVDTGDGRSSGSVSAQAGAGAGPPAHPVGHGKELTSGRWSWPSWCSWGRHVGLAAPV
jgi:hypothetical protein